MCAVFLSPERVTFQQSPQQPHKESTCICKKDDRERPRKKRKRGDLENGNDKENGEEAEDESEKDAFNMFRSLLENLHHLDKELAILLCQNICSLFGLLFSDPKDMFSSLKATDR